MRALFGCFLATLLTASAVIAQDQRVIRRGRPISGTLESGAQHRFAIELDSNRFVAGEVNQLTVDVVVRIVGPDGEEVGDFDSPARGPEFFRFETEMEGTFVIEVSPFEEGEGDYVIEVNRVERVATDPDDRVDQLMSSFADASTPGAVVGVMQAGEMEFVRAYGAANLEHGIPFEVGTISNIGSVTKQFTAMGILLLQAEGELSIDDDIRKFIPELPKFATPVTLRNLLNHTGGYREIYNLLPITGDQGEDTFERDVAIQIVQRQPDLQAPPNTEFNYNNTGFILLATTIERISEMTFPQYMKERVFDPLGMTDTRVKAHQAEIIPGSAQGYVAGDNGYQTARDLASSYGAGGIYTTVADMTRWMLNYRDATVGGPEAIEAITTSAVLANGDTTHYGLGLGVRHVRGRTVFTHTGGDTAHRTYFVYFPELVSGVILMSNNSTADLSLGWQIATLFFEDEFEPEEAEEETTTSETSMSVERMEAIAGDWVIEGGGVTLAIVYSVEDGQVFAQATGQPKFRVIPTSDSTFNFDGVAASVTFHFESDGTVDRATHHQGGNMSMRRVERVELTAEDLEEFANRYFCEELEVFYELKVEEGQLVIHNLRMEPIQLTHSEGDTFSSSQFFLATVEFRRSGNGQITGFFASNGRTKNVWFQRQ